MGLRKVIIAGNWKMNKTKEEALLFLQAIKNKVPVSDQVEAIICSPDLFLDALVDESKGSQLKIGAQNMHFEVSGAFTGETSPHALKDLGVTYVIIGHSERREMFGETDEGVNKKAIAAFKHGLFPIICVGETLKEHEDGRTSEIVTSQVKAALENLAEEQVKNTIIAYEPIWAIGTGKTASSEDANETCGVIRQVVEENVSTSAAESIHIQYGGSVNKNNISELLSQPHIDGALVGGASLDPESFMELVEAGHE